MTTKAFEQFTEWANSARYIPVPGENALTHDDGTKVNIVPKTWPSSTHEGALGYEVIIGNTEDYFDTLREAQLHLWNEWVKWTRTPHKYIVTGYLVVDGRLEDVPDCPFMPVHIPFHMELTETELEDFNSDPTSEVWERTNAYQYSFEEIDSMRLREWTVRPEYCDIG